MVQPRDRQGAVSDCGYLVEDGDGWDFDLSNARGGAGEAGVGYAANAGGGAGHCGFSRLSDGAWARRISDFAAAVAGDDSQYLGRSGALQGTVLEQGSESVLHGRRGALRSGRVLLDTGA